MTHRSSLTLGDEKIEPRSFAHVHSNPEIGPYAGVDITANFTVSCQDVETLLEISTAFADAAHALIRLEDQQALAERTAQVDTQAQAVTA